MLNQQREQPRWVKYAACAFAIIWLVCFSYRYIDPTSRKDRAILGNLSNQEIESISIEPARQGYPTVIGRPIVVDNKQMIAVFARALSGMPTHFPEHHKVIRAAILRIQLKGRVLGGYLEESSNDGTTFYCMSNVTNGWVFGTYAVLDGHKLFDYIEQFSSTHTGPTG
jgi:hypothetical protein